MSPLESPLWPPVVVLAAAAVPAPAIAATYLGVESAQHVLFPEARAFEPIPIAPTPAERQTILQTAGAQAPHGNLRAWAARGDSGTLGFVFVDEVVGRDDFITYAVGIDNEGRLRPVEILEYRESHGGEVRNKRWLAQFAGRSKAAELRFRTDIKNIAGATLSCEHVTAGVRRVLAIWETLLGPGARPAAGR